MNAATNPAALLWCEECNHRRRGIIVGPDAICETCSSYLCSAEELENIDNSLDLEGLAVAIGYQLKADGDLYDYDGTLTVDRYQVHGDKITLTLGAAYGAKYRAVLRLERVDTIADPREEER
jgi:hypothetical protein